LLVLTDTVILMKPAIEQSDREFLERLHRLGSGTVQEICRAIGVTATAVRQRLVRLQGMDLVSREAVRTGRGRPRHVYRLTDAGLRELGDNYGELAVILWQEIGRIEETEVRTAVVRRIRDAFVERFGAVVHSEAPLDQRVSQLSNSLLDFGFDVEVDSTGTLPILRENNCPYLELAISDPGICELEHAVFERILGVGIKQTRSCLDGHSCCDFQLMEEGGRSIETVADADKVDVSSG